MYFNKTIFAVDLLFNDGDVVFPLIHPFSVIFKLSNAVIPPTPLQFTVVNNSLLYNTFVLIITELFILHPSGNLTLKMPVLGTVNSTIFIFGRSVKLWLCEVKWDKKIILKYYN